jgi:hypothetical protein
MPPTPRLPATRAEPRIDPDLDASSGGAMPLDDGGSGAPPPATRKTIPILALLLLVVLCAGALFYYLWRQSAPPAPVSAGPPVEAPPVAAAAAVAPAIQHPIEDAQGAAPVTAEVKPLPALMVSDTTMQNTLVDLFGAASLGKVFYEDAIIHRFVATIDNLPRKSVPSRNLPVKPVPGLLVTTAKDAGVSLGADNAARYAPYVQLADAIDTKALVAAYVHFYPLLQQDYVDLGYPKGYFNDRLVEAIDDLLAAPESNDPLSLVQPKVLYQYADADLESRSAGQKIMIRMGGQNSAKLKAKLREVRRELTGPNATRPAAAEQPQ